MTEIHSIGDNNISVYLRSHKSGECYYARYKIANKRVANNQRYITESLRTSSLVKAKDRARQRYVEIAHLERQGVSLKSGSVATEIDAFYTEYESGVSQKLSGYSRNMLLSFRKTLLRYWKSYLGKKSLSDVSIDHMREYEEWRQNFWKNQKNKSSIHPRAKLASHSIRILISAALAATQYKYNRTANRTLPIFTSDCVICIFPN